MNGNLREQFGALLQEERQSRGLTQAELGKLAKLSRGYIAAIERGEANVTIGAMERLSHALDWNPFASPSPAQRGMPYGIRKMVLTALTHISQLAQTVIPWMETLDDAMVWHLVNTDRISLQPHSSSLTRPRPRKPRQALRNIQWL
jgi:DNA-binding XRE family transcriptional regulator